MCVTGSVEAASLRRTTRADRLRRERDVGIAAELSNYIRNPVRTEVVVRSFLAIGLVVECRLGDRQLQERRQDDRALGRGKGFHAFERIPGVFTHLLAMR